MQQQTVNTTSAKKKQSGGGRKTTIRKQRHKPYWRYHTAVVIAVWVGCILWFMPGDITPAHIIGIVLGGFVVGVLAGYLVKTFYAMKRGAKHRRIVRKRAAR